MDPAMLNDGSVGGLMYNIDQLMHFKAITPLLTSLYKEHASEL